jgi:hypothetical protein
MSANRPPATQGGGRGQVPGQLPRPPWLADLPSRPLPAAAAKLAHLHERQAGTLAGHCDTISTEPLDIRGNGHARTPPVHAWPPPTSCPAVLKPATRAGGTECAETEGTSHVLATAICGGAPHAPPHEPASMRTPDMPVSSLQRVKRVCMMSCIAVASGPAGGRDHCRGPV